MMRLLKIIRSVLLLPFIAMYSILRLRAMLRGVVLLAGIPIVIGMFVLLPDEFRAGEQL